MTIPRGLLLAERVVSRFVHAPALASWGVVGHHALMGPPQIEICFGVTTSALVSDAVRHARALPGFRQDLEGKRATYSVAVPIRDAILSQDTSLPLLRLIGIASRWKTTKITIGGTAVDRWEIESDLRQTSDCYRDRCANRLNDEYCSGKQHPTDQPSCFGCRQLTGISRKPSEYCDDPLWFHYGTVSSDATTFAVDKGKIIALLEDRSARALCRHCPAFSPERLRSDVASLPDCIQLDGDSAFEVRNSTETPDLVLGIQVRKRRAALHSGIGALLGDPDEDTDTDSPSTSARSVPSVRYTEVAGLDRAVAEIRDVIELPLTKPEYFAAIDLRPHRGVILYGPPGTGKTLLVKAVATESNANLEIINGPEILSKWIGQSEENLREIFQRARRLQPSIILIDELDSIAATRDEMTEHHGVTLISQLLTLLDGIEGLGNVFVIGTTNRLEAIDPAIRRPGRFDYHICLQIPDAAGRLAILRVHLERLRWADGAAPAWLADATDGWSGAELAAVCREGGLIAVKRAIRAQLPSNAVQLTETDLRRAFSDLLTKRAEIGTS